MNNIPVEEDIVKIIGDAVITASQVSPPTLFGHGPESYANLQGQDEAIPQNETAWLFPYNIDDAVTASGGITSKYNVMLGFGKKGDLDSSKEDLEALQRAMFILSKRFLVALVDDDRIKELTSIRREPAYHVQALNLTGWLASLTIELDFEKFDYCLT